MNFSLNVIKALTNCRFLKSPRDYLSDGFTEDIITDLSQISGPSVVGRNTVFTDKGKSVKLQQAAMELGVRFLLEGRWREYSDCSRKSFGSYKAASQDQNC